MAGPWEKYAQPEAATPAPPAGPWTKYAPAAAPEAQAPGPWLKYKTIDPNAGPEAPSNPGQLEPKGVPAPLEAPAEEVGGVQAPGRAPPPAVSPETEDPGIATKILAPFRRGILQSRGRNVIAQTLAGGKDIPTAAAEFAEIARERAMIPERDEYVEGLKARNRMTKGLAPEYEGFKGHLKFFYDHPGYVVESLFESSIPTLESAAGGAVGAAVGGLAGAPLGPVGSTVGAGLGLAAGAGGTSGVTEGLGKYLEALSEAGIDVTNEQSLAGAFANPELLAEAKKKALAKGMFVGTFDSLTAFLGVRGAGKVIGEAVFDPLARVVGAQTVKKTMTRQAVEEGAASLLFLEAPGGMAGEALGELSAEGEIDWIDVMMEGVGEAAFSAPQVGLQVALAQAERDTPVADERAIKDVFTAITEIPAFETAEAEGRTWYGFVDVPYQQDQGGRDTTIPKGSRAAIQLDTGRWYAGATINEAYQAAENAGIDLSSTTVKEGRIDSGGNFTLFPERSKSTIGTRVYQDYTKAEEIMGQNDPRKGRLVAASADDITATSADALMQRDKNPALRFTDTAREAEARASWEKFVSDKGTAADYKQAVELGLRLAPAADHAEFVGDLTASEILPKSELPLREDVYTVKSTVDGPVAKTRHRSLNSVTLLQDSRFKVYPTKNSLQQLSSHPKHEQLAAAVFEIKDATLEAQITADGWGKFLTDLANTSDPSSVFTSGAIKLRPSLVWATKLLSPTDVLVVESNLPKDALKAALDTHLAILPRGGGLGGVSDIDTTLQVPYLGGYTNPGWDLEPTVLPASGQVAVYLTKDASLEFTQTVRAWESIAQKVWTNLGLKNRLIVVAGANPASLKTQFKPGDFGRLSILLELTGPSMGQTNTGDAFIFVDETTNQANRYNVFMHEFGHALSFSALSQLPLSQQAQIFAAYRRYLLTYRSSTLSQAQRGEHQTQRSLSSATKNLAGAFETYYLSFEEWFAEQVSRWGTTSAKPVGAAAKFFQRLGHAIIRMVRAFQERYGVVQPKAEPIIQEWLDAVYAGKPNWSHSVRQSLVEKTKAKNRTHGILYPLQAESVKAASVIHGIIGNNVAPPGSSPGVVGSHTPGALNAQMDQFNVLMKYGTAFHQLAQANPHIPALQLYAELMRMMRLVVNNIMAEAETILKQHIRPLRKQKTAGRSQADRLADFLFDMTEMVYRTPTEVARGIRRNPTAQELAALIRRHQLSAEAVTAYEKIRDFFVEVVIRGEEIATNEARVIFANDPVQLSIAIGQAQIMTRKLLAAPYFPMTRFGNWAVTIRNINGAVEHFETFETKKDQQRAMVEATRIWPPAQGWSITASTLPEEAQAFNGMPPWFLDLLAKMPGMTPQQQEWMKLLRYQVAPAQSFRKHLLPRKKTPGYSRDMERVFARYAFQHARHYGRLKFQRGLDEQIKALRSEFVQTNMGVHDVNKRTRMADFLQDHFNEVMNPRADWHILRSVTSVWYLGFMVSSAALNMTQVLLMSFPFLGAKFSDARSAKALMSAASDLSTFYKRGSYAGQTSGEMQMLDYLIKRGDITESMAAELAGLAAGNSLDSYFGFADKAQRGWLAFADKAMLMFKLVEQFNRRVTARAAYRLALAEPNNAYVQGLAQTYYLEYQTLVLGGTRPSEALAILAAQDAILKTQYDYSKEARPRFMRGKAGLLFAFYMFTQNTIFQLVSKQNKGLFIRYALIMTFLAGPMGLLPDDAEDILNFIGRKFFGKDFNLHLEARRLVMSLVGDPKWSDGILHGTGRYTFGIPALMEAVGGPAIPEIDMSRLLELRNIAPLPITKGLDVIDRGVDVEKQISRWARDMAGAGFGLPFAWVQALGDGELDLTDPKRWEKAVPRAMGKLMQTWRLSTERGERFGRSTYVMEYDKSDPQDVAEIVAKALGFTPTRESVGWDLQSAQREVDVFWTAKRQGLLARAYQARIVEKNDELWKETRQAILDFNKEVPDPKKRISPETLKRSFKARMTNQRKFLQGGPSALTKPGRDIQALFPGVRRVSEQPLPDPGR